MTTTSVSPFKLIRWENEDSRHFYFLDTSDYRKIREARKHCFIIGHRGTGKTSLLKALNWRERTSNPALAGDLQEDAFSDGVVGCYFGLQYLQMDVLNDWLKDANTSISHAILSGYLRGLWIEEACKAVGALRMRAGTSSLSGEIDGFEGVAEEFEQWLPVAVRAALPVSEGPATLKRIRDAATAMTVEIYGRASDMFSSPASVVGDLRLGRLADLTNHLFEALASLLPDGPTVPWVFQMCIDEGEYLSESGRRTVRTLVRECRSPLLMTVASLDDLGVETTNPRVRLTVHDRVLLDLRSRSLRQFIDLINGIMNERLSSMNMGEGDFDVDTLLGSFTLDELLLSARPERPGSRRQLTAWAEAAASENVDPAASAPIRTFLAGSGTVDISDDVVDRRASESAGYRKKFVAGYLKLLATLGVREPVYAGTKISLRMMENSLRDVFLFLDACFELAELDNASDLRDRLDHYLSRRPVPARVQNAALKKLSVDKMADLDGRLVNLTSVSRALVEFLSRLSNKLDMDPSPRSITIPERTSFQFEVPAVDGNLPGRREQAARTNAILEAIHNCAREGYLVGGVNPSRPNQLQVRVNRSLAKLHGFSYRQPQYVSRVRWEHLDRIAHSLGDLDIEALASRAYEEVTGTTSRSVGSRRPGSETWLTIPLFEMESDEVGY
jgi:hypothetical protein